MFESKLENRDGGVLLTCGRDINPKLLNTAFHSSYYQPLALLTQWAFQYWIELNRRNRLDVPIFFPEEELFIPYYFQFAIENRGSTGYLWPTRSDFYQTLGVSTEGCSSLSTQEVLRVFGQLNHFREEDISHMLRASRR